MLVHASVRGCLMFALRSASFEPENYALVFVVMCKSLKYSDHNIFITTNFVLSLLNILCAVSGGCRGASPPHPIGPTAAILFCSLTVF